MACHGLEMALPHGEAIGGDDLRLVADEAAAGVVAAQAWRNRPDTRCVRSP